SPWPHSAQWPLCWRWDCSSPDRAVPNWSVVLWTGRVSSRPGPSAAVTVVWSWSSTVVSACVTASTSPDAWSTGAVPMGTVEHLAVVGRGSRPRLVLDRFFDLGRGVSCPEREGDRSEEHTSELQSRFDLVCRLLLEKKKRTQSEENHVRRQQNHN